MTSYYTILHVSLFLVSGLKVDVGSATDSQEADALGHENDYIMIYSNSWGPSDLGFIVDGPDVYTKTTFSNAVTSVSFYYVLLTILLSIPLCMYILLPIVTETRKMLSIHFVLVCRIAAFSILKLYMFSV